MTSDVPQMSHIKCITIIPNKCKGRIREHKSDTRHTTSYYTEIGGALNFYEILSINTPCLIEFSTLFPQRQPFISISFNKSVKFVAIYALFLG